MSARSQKQISFRSDEVAEIVGRLARRRGQTAKQVVIDALRREEALADQAFRNMSPEKLEDYLFLRNLSAKYKAMVVPGSTSTHDELFDEDGLPR
jgi:antitoxin VapB